jgi:hypothetical protein
MNRSLLLISAVVLGFALISCLSQPASSENPAPAPTQSILVPEATQPVPQPPAILETRRLTLEYPPRMRAGVEGDIVRLTLAVDDLGNITPTAEVEGNVITGEMIEIPNLYETHDVIAEARLDLAGMQVQPANSIFEPLKPGQSVTFYWSIRPQDPGEYRGTAWLHLNFREKSTGEESRIAVSAQPVQIEAVDFFGLSVNVVRTSGVIGSVVGGILGFPFLEQILRFVFGKRKPRKT